MHSIRSGTWSRGLESLLCSAGRQLHSPRISPLRASLTQQTTRYASSASSPEKAFQERLLEVKAACPEPYPRLAVDQRTLSCAEFRTQYDGLANNDSVEEIVVVSGFLLLAGWERLSNNVAAVTGKPHRTGRGELTINATEVPRLLSPCLHDVPVYDSSHETSPYPRHVQFLTDPAAADIIRARSSLIQYLRQFFVNKEFMEVSTPIIESVAGGAIARPFYTSATEFPERQLSLRIAPELWLKRMVVGGFDKIFEIGPSFRNEGLDKTHNPEFTTCEFYHAYANLEDLMRITEDLLSGMAAHIQAFNKNNTLQPTQANFTAPFRRIDFITGIEEGLHQKLPDLSAPDALDQIRRLFNSLSLPLPAKATLPRLLDELCSIYVEPQCQDPTFIINPPECLSPLSKSFTNPANGQRVGARGELFIEGKEVINTYEEENSPFEQRRKFEDQLRFGKDVGEPGEIDENYLEALQWGLPATGGWGCGIDRLVMLFTGAKKIADVLPFGNLRAVSRRAGGSE
ncbi:hypothetical protein N7470_008165 [Penicillium chermesinum]|nr:hypothetical protein N7470_008165 [Penicillium chermesinum]